LISETRPWEFSSSELLKTIANRKRNKLYPLELLCAGKTHEVKDNEENENAHKISQDSEIEGKSVGTAQILETKTK